MTKDDFIRKTLLALASNCQGNINLVTTNLATIKELAEQVFPTDKEQQHRDIIKILRNANIALIANPQTSMEDKYNHLKEVLTDTELTQEDINLFSHL